MTTTYSAEAIEQMEDEIWTIVKFHRDVVIFLVPQLTTLIMSTRPHAQLRDKQLMTALLAVYLYLWRFPLTFLLQYHRVALPTWLTFGYPVAFGGVLPNVCDDTIKEIALWPCIYEDSKTWLVNVAGPHGWRYLVHPNSALLWCAALLIWMLVAPMLMVKVFRNTPTGAANCRPARTAPQGPSDESEGKAKDLEAGAISRESSKNREQ